jgi:ubiquinone/menaquinone biosynthesis C-methylase UbiE
MIQKTERSFSKLEYSFFRRQYEVEKKLADKLRDSDRTERKLLYKEIYDYLYKEFPHLAPIRRSAETEAISKFVSPQMRYLKPFLNHDSKFMEIGAGDCTLALHVAKNCREVIAVDVSEEVTKKVRGTTIPSNFRLVICNGVEIPLPRNSINIAYSSQLIEHLYPDDAIIQLKEIYDALVPSGIYICITPNKLTGPHDVSKYFDKIATGLHLKEYTYKEITNLFRKAGFSRVFGLITTRFRSSPFLCPIFLLILIEKFAGLFPKEISKKIAQYWLGPLSLNQIRIVGRK